MITNIQKLFLSSIFLLVIFSSCFKEDISRNTLLLTSQSWRFDAYGLDENNNGIVDETENSMQSCEQDDRFTFMMKGTGFFERNELSCTSGEPEIINFTWSFNNNESELAIFAAPEKINRLDENFLEVYFMDVNSLGEAVKYIRRFRH